MGIAVLQQCPQRLPLNVWIEYGKNGKKCDKAKSCIRKECIYRVVDKVT
ncbi:MAG: hypothetical protein AAB405_01515 [Patescibacteria group bacterium]